jgi:hypothetical protein
MMHLRDVILAAGCKRTWGPDRPSEQMASSYSWNCRRMVPQVTGKLPVAVCATEQAGKKLYSLNFSLVSNLARHHQMLAGSLQS